MSPPRNSKPQSSAPEGGVPDGKTGGDAVSATGRTGKGDRAFDTWLKQGLHKLYDDIANEPIPDALLKMIEQDRRK